MLDADVGVDGRSGDEVDELDAEESKGPMEGLLTVAPSPATTDTQARLLDVPILPDCHRPL